MNQETIIFKENPDQNALEFLASGKGFYGDRLRLEILNKIFIRIFNQNL